jgi:hypothetical protein
VDAEVTVFAEEDPVGDVGAAVVGCPFVWAHGRPFRRVAKRRGGGAGGECVSVYEVGWSQRGSMQPPSR